METTLFGLSVTGVAGVAIGLIWFLVSKGLKSKCVVKGMVMSVDIHKQTESDISPKPLDVDKIVHAIEDAVRKD